MEENHKLLPLLFREIPAYGKYLLSNQGGAVVFLDNRKQLENLISGNINYLESSKLEELSAKSFISESGEYQDRRLTIWWSL